MVRIRSNDTLLGVSNNKKYILIWAYFGVPFFLGNLQIVLRTFEDTGFMRIAYLQNSKVLSENREREWPVGTANRLRSRFFITAS